MPLTVNNIDEWIHVAAVVVATKQIKAHIRRMTPIAISGSSQQVEKLETPSPIVLPVSWFGGSFRVACQRNRPSCCGQ